MDIQKSSNSKDKAGKERKRRIDSIKGIFGKRGSVLREEAVAENSECKIENARVKTASGKLYKQPQMNLHFLIKKETDSKFHKWFNMGCLRCKAYPRTKNPVLDNYKGGDRWEKTDVRIKTYACRSVGSSKPKILFVGDCASAVDDSYGAVFSGTYGNLINSALNDAGIDADDCRYTVAMRCNLGEDKSASFTDCIPCSAFLVNEISRYKPDIIVPLGATVVKLLTNNSVAKLSDYLGVEHEISLTTGDYKMFALWSIGLIYHDISYYQDFVHYLTKLKQIVYNVQKLDDIMDIFISKDAESLAVVEDKLEAIYSGDTCLAFDIESASLDVEEASALDPYSSKTRIVSIAFSYTNDKAITLYTYHPKVDESVLIRNKEIAIELLESHIPKIAHNAKFDMKYILLKWGVTVNNFIEDTMLTHYAVVTERKKSHGLKLLASRYADVGDYSKLVREEEVFESGKVFSVSLDEFGKYNALDVIVTRRISDIFKTLADENNTPARRVAYDLLPKATETLNDVEINGLYIDVKVAKKVLAVFKRNMNVVEDSIMSDVHVKRFIKKLPILRKKGIVGKSVGSFKINSGQQLAVIFYNKRFYNYDVIENTDSGQPSTKIQVLNKLSVLHKDDTLINLIIEQRRLKKTIGTYLNTFVERAVKGKGIMHGNFNLFVTSTGRLCVAKGTMVDVVRDLSKNLSGIPIEDVKVGDLVYTYNDELNLDIRPVKWGGKTGIKKVIRVHWESRGNSKKRGYVDLTPEHEIRKSNGLYCQARNLKPGDSVLPLTCEITKIEEINEFVDVYDLEVEDTHNFIAGGLCVHNSSASPNLQNIPNKSAGHVKRLFTSRYKNGVLIGLDYSQIELRVLAALSGDERMLDIYREGKDLHQQTMFAIYDTDEDESSQWDDSTRKLRRTVAKRINFGIAYGITAEGIVRILENEGILVNNEEAEHYIEMFFRNYPSVKTFINKIENRMFKTGNSVSVFGRVRRFPEVTSFNVLLGNSPTDYIKDRYFNDNFGKINSAKRQAVNHVIQSTASDITLCSLVVLNGWLKSNYDNVCIYNSIHDAIDLDASRDVILPVINKAVNIMTDLPQYIKHVFPKHKFFDAFYAKIPFEVSVEIGVNWRDMVEVKKGSELTEILIDGVIKESLKLQKEMDKKLITEVVN